jgi:hypothetical protein
MYNKIREHIERHKTIYVCAATGIGVAAFTCIIMRDRHAVLQTGADGSDVTTMRSLSFNFFSKQSESGNVITTISRDGRGHPGYITRWIEGMIDYETQGLAAQEHGVKPSVMSLHIQGKIPDIDGDHFIRVPA